MRRSPPALIRRRSLFFFDVIIVILFIGITTRTHASSSGGSSAAGSSMETEAGGGARQQQQQFRTVSTSFGVLRGETVQFQGASSHRLVPVTQFLGVPYGMAPSSQTRFNMAVSAAKWIHKPKDAFRMPPVCVQSDSINQPESEAFRRTSSLRFDRTHKLLPFLRPQSENCLFMNLFVPATTASDGKEEGASSSLQQQPLSVLVLVHGGDYEWGGAPAHNPSLLASFGKIMVVTLNYRLGVFGWLGRCEESGSCTGNAGLADLVAALTMLSNILPSFGADPGAVTLLGWESGAALVSLLMASPITQPKSRLFRRAILLDGTALSPWALTENPQENFMQLASHLLCYKPDQPGDKQQRVHFQRELNKILRCLQEHSPYNLTTAARRILAPTFLTAFGPIIDGQIVPNHPKVSFSPRFGALFRDIDLLVGTVTHPAHQLLPNADLEQGLGAERRNRMLRTLVRNLYDFHRSEIFHSVLNEYTDWENPRDHPRSMRDSLLHALNDVLFTAPLVDTLRMHATEEFQRTSNTFFFHFAHETPGWTRERPTDGIRGSLSDDHIPYVLGYPMAVEHANRNADDAAGGGGASAASFFVYGSAFTIDDRALSRVMMTYVANFVRSGDPSKPRPAGAESSIEDRFHGVPWPQFSAATREAYLEISADMARVRNFYRNAYVSFWSILVPLMNKPSKGAPEEHNFLTDYFNSKSFYGTVRPYSSLHNIPFPPPPLPPTPFPHDTKKQLQARPKNATSDDDESLNSSHRQPQQHPAMVTPATISDYFNSIWTLGIMGTAFSILNFCLFVAWINKCCTRRKEKKALNYRGYAGPSPLSPMDVNLNYIPNNFAAQLPQRLQSSASRSSQLLAAMTTSMTAIGTNEKRTSFIVDDSASANPRADDHTSSGVGGSAAPRAASASSRRSSSIPRTVPLTAAALRRADDDERDDRRQHQTTSVLLKRGTFSALAGGALSAASSSRLATGEPKEQDPLLPGIRIGPGISPTCPRHGRAAQLLAAANRQQQQHQLYAAAASGSPPYGAAASSSSPATVPAALLQQQQQFSSRSHHQQQFQQQLARQLQQQQPPASSLSASAAAANHILLLQQQQHQQQQQNNNNGGGGGALEEVQV